jgi:heme A synthase
LLLIAALIIAGTVWWTAQQIVGELRATRDEAARARTLTLIELFAPAIGAAQADPRALLAWQPLAKMARQLFPTDCAALDRAAGGTFPFTSEHAQAAHAQWTADWLAWERTHDAEYKLKAADAEQELVASGGSAAHRAKLDAIESEKLDLYQRRYSEYVRVAKALQALT